MKSLQSRFVMGATVWAIAITISGTFTLLAAFDQIAKKRFDSDLLERHAQLVLTLEELGSPELVEDRALDPAYARTYSGRYWQITDSAGNIFTSPSLFDKTLSVSPNSGRLESFLLDGPLAQVRGFSQLIKIDDEFTISVAESIAVLEIERSKMRQNLAIGFGVVGLLGVFGGLYLVNLMLAPLTRLRSDVNARWESENGLNATDYPTEVAPLVLDINELIARNKKIISHGRRQAADLAHVLKTPLAALKNELDKLSSETEVPTGATEAMGRIEAQITRSLARMRAEHATLDVDLRTDVSNSITRLERLFSYLPEAERVNFEIVQRPSTSAAIDFQDFEEIIGNLLENAQNWCKKQVRLTVEADQNFVLITIEDDGPGIDEIHRERVMGAGGRLDSKKPGSGLGLSIANDLCEAYGGGIELSDSADLGGLKVKVRIPRSQS